MKKALGGFERQLCDIQGRLFERSLKKGLDSPDFVEKFMNSKTCGFLDLPYDRLQWAGEEYIMEDLLDEMPVKPIGERYGSEELFWMGYIYRYWHYMTGESGRDIYIQAKARRMKECYLGFHTLDAVMAIEDLKEIYRQEQTLRQ
ncbi:MAG: hypothetical protein FWD23_12075 [Oscillospiraceae bacterium]|nr:hypothetical protein [Oscillospiraceae bacterium]